MPRAKKTHSDQCLAICIGCLQRPKGLRPLVPKNGNNSLETLVSTHMYAEYFSDKEHLPKVICANCRLKLEGEWKAIVIILFKAEKYFICTLLM